MEKRSIRPMMPTDWKSVARIYQQGMDTNMATFESTCPSFEAFDASHRKICRFVVTLDNHVAGWAALSPISSRHVYRGVAEVSIYLDDQYRGLGLGYALLSHLAESSEQEGIWTLQSGIFENNVASLRLHEKCGFRVVGFRERIGQDQCGIWRNTILLEKRSEIIR